MVQSAVERFEPRLQHVNVSLEDDKDPLDRVLRFRIEAVLVTEYDDEQLVFVFDAGTRLGQVQGGGRRTVRKRYVGQAPPVLPGRTRLPAPFPRRFHDRAAGGRGPAGDPPRQHPGPARRPPGRGLRLSHGADPREARRRIPRTDRLPPQRALPPLPGARAERGHRPVRAQPQPGGTDRRLHDRQGHGSGDFRSQRDHLPFPHLLRHGALAPGSRQLPLAAKAVRRAQRGAGPRRPGRAGSRPPLRLQQSHLRGFSPPWNRCGSSFAARTTTPCRFTRSS